MGPNAAIMLEMALQAAIQLQQYQLAIARANAEGRDVTDEEVTVARSKAVQKTDALEQMP